MKGRGRGKKRGKEKGREESGREKNKEEGGSVELPLYCDFTKGSMSAESNDKTMGLIFYKSSFHFIF